MTENGRSSELSLLRRRLKYLHERYGEFAEDNGYVRCEDSEVRAMVIRSRISRRCSGEGGTSRGDDPRYR